MFVSWLVSRWLRPAPTTCSKPASCDQRPLRLPLLIPCYAEMALEAEAAAAGVAAGLLLRLVQGNAGRLGEAAVVPAWAEAVTAVLAGWLMAEAVG